MLLRKDNRTSPASQGVVIFGERSCLSLIVAGSSMNAALGGVSAGGVGTPELDVAHVVLDQPEGSAGGVTSSNDSVKSKLGSRQRTSTCSLSSIATATAILVRATAAAVTTSGQSTKGNDRVNLLFIFFVMDLTRIRLHLAIYFLLCPEKSDQKAPWRELCRIIRHLGKK